MLGAIPDFLVTDRDKFLELLGIYSGELRVKLSAPIGKAILSALSERDESAEICRDKEGHPEFDPELRDTEKVPLLPGEDPVDGDGVPESVRAFFDREVRPHVPGTWINTAIRDQKDGKVGKVGYEINFNRYFYKYEPPRPLEEIEADIRKIGREIVEMLRGEAGGRREGR